MRRTLILASVLALGVGAGAMWWQHVRVPTAESHQGHEAHQGADAGSPVHTVSKDVVAFGGPRGTSWDLHEAKGADGLCLEVTGLLGDESGSVAGCGLKSVSDFSWVTGGIELGGDWYSVAFGGAPAAGSDVEVTFGNGAHAAPEWKAIVEEGYWIAISRTESSVNDTDLEIREVAIKSASGDTLVRISLPSVTEMNKRADEAVGT